MSAGRATVGILQMAFSLVKYWDMRLRCLPLTSENNRLDLAQTAGAVTPAPFHRAATGSLRG
jgi:hypothetical protein